MKCPKCNSSQVRPSKRSRWFDLYLTLGRRRFRCRDCRRSFYAREKPESSAEPSARPRDRKGSGDHFRSVLSRQTQRRLREALIFAIMLALFIVFLRYLTREPAAGNPDSLGTSQSRPPASQTTNCRALTAPMGNRHTRESSRPLVQSTRHT